MGPGAPDVSGGILLILLMVILFVILVPVYWSAFFATRVLRKISVVYRHLAGFVFGVIVAFLACFVAMLGIAYGSSYLGLHLPIVFVLVMFFCISVAVRRFF